jgi:hypothetical protein
MVACNHLVVYHINMMEHLKRVDLKPIPNSFVEEDVFDYELKELMLQMKQQIMEVLLPFISILRTFDKR